MLFDTGDYSLYAVGYYAMSAELRIESFMQVGWVAAKDESEAKQRAETVCMRLYPEDIGYIAHSIVVVPLYESMLNKMLAMLAAEED